ncbi:peptidoglycan recognition family protein [Porticoccus sp. W117]|uniref:peptidoglycan recognition protein family protein n=1 Tax=Porticoccus sp. W117 TaxID=3054777 RepID=UPI00259A74A3|nr:peptidoglycan recognition family protein [Porticoccus sp. W117]MDM3870446.1 peptidoglycan recognition family protein [Porticoccus sp. W117]
MKKPIKKRLCYIAIALVLIAAAIIYWPNRWHYIVIHHSAGNYGTIEFLQDVHRQRQAGDPIDAIPYHYVIGNGNGLDMGEVASDWRQENHIWGTHVSSNNRDRNFRGIGICLIGNYEKNTVPKAQYDALVTLTRELMAKYNIPPERVSGHGYTDGESTKCPGKNFPMASFMKDIAR